MNSPLTHKPLGSMFAGDLATVVGVKLAKVRNLGATPQVVAGLTGQDVITEERMLTRLSRQGLVICTENKHFELSADGENVLEKLKGPTLSSLLTAAQLNQPIIRE